MDCASPILRSPGLPIMLQWKKKHSTSNLIYEWSGHWFFFLPLVMLLFFISRHAFVSKSHNTSQCQCFLLAEIETERREKLRLWFSNGDKSRGQLALRMVWLRESPHPWNRMMETRRLTTTSVGRPGMGYPPTAYTKSGLRTKGIALLSSQSPSTWSINPMKMHEIRRQ